MVQHQEQVLGEQTQLLNRLEERNGTLKRTLHFRLAEGKQITTKLQALALEQEATEREIVKQSQRVERCEAKVIQANERLQREQQKLEKHEKEQASIESNRRIFQHDVELDSIFSVLKVALLLSVNFVLKEYFGNARMEPLTFLDRVATLPARLRVLPDVEILTFPYNHRDPDVMTLLTEHCDAINARGVLTRSGRKLQIHVDPPPPPSRRPTGRRTKSGDRFRSG